MYSTCPPTRRIGIQTKRCGTTSNTKNSRDTRPRPKRRSRSWPNVSSPTCPRTLNCSGESTSGAVLQIYCLEPYLSNFATINVLDELLRLDGVSDINLFGQRDYSMRAWLDPQKLAAHNITAKDVAAAIQAQNKETAP